MKKETTTAANVAKAQETRIKIETIRKSIDARNIVLGKIIPQKSD